LDNSATALLYYFDSVGPSMVIASATA
jgi:hypothetical protein